MWVAFIHLISELLRLVEIPLLGIILLHTLLNMRMLSRLKAAPIKGEILQNLSVLVPARNEERRIRECLTSLIAQEPRVREIILLNDHSADRTAEIALELGFREGAGQWLRIIHGDLLPEGWVGKNWACHQLSLASDPKSSHLLFTDADTIHGSSCHRSALAHAKERRTDLLSLWPDQITGTWSEKLVIPLGYLLFMSFQPFAALAWLQSVPERVSRWRFSRTQLASMGAANGQFLLFSRSAYEKLGGHEALKDHLVEDIAFGRRVAAGTGDGMRLVNADGIDLLRCRMYVGFSELWEGFSKNLRPVFEESQVGFFLFGLVISMLFLIPFGLLLLGWYSVAFKDWIYPALICVVLIYTTRFLLTIRFRTSWLGLIAHPIGLAMALLIAVNSWRLCLGRGVSWKGRHYSGTTRSSL